MTKKEELKAFTEKKKNLNDTSIFLLPSLGIKNETWFKLGFINAFLSDINREEKENKEDNYLYLLFKPTDIQKVELNRKIQLLEQGDEQQKFYVDDYDYPGGYVVLVVKFPQKFKKDYKRFLKGKYSYFSKEYQDVFPETVTTDFINEKGIVEKLIGKSFQLLVINRDPSMKAYTEKQYDIELDDDDEVYHMYIPENEILNIDSIINKKD